MKNRLGSTFTLLLSQHTLRKSYYGGSGPVEVIPGTNQNQEVIDNLNNWLGSFGRSNELIHHLGEQYTRIIDKFLFMPAELTAGAEYLNNTLTHVSEYRTYDVDQKTHITSGFLQNEWKNDRWNILLGSRLDKHSLVKPVK